MTDRKIFRLQILDLATEHFLVLSAAVLITAVVAGTIFLFGYLASFDWRLIFIIEYADILKISLIFVGALSTIIVVTARKIRCLGISRIAAKREHDSECDRVLRRVRRIGVDENQR